MYDDGQDGMMMDKDWAQDDVEKDETLPVRMRSGMSRSVRVQI